MLIRIMIVKKHSGCFIRPPYVPAGRGDTVRFIAINIDDEAQVIINFPGPTPFEGGAKEFIVEKDKPAEAIIHGKAPDGTYPFSAFCTECNAFAEGGSFGELIVGP